MQRTIIAIVVTIAVLACAQAYAQENVTVVANPSVSATSMSGKDLARVFLKKKSSWPDGANAMPVDQSVKSPMREVFAQEVLGMSIKELDSYWQSQVFAGRKAPPPTVSSDEEVLAFVRANEGAVGYVSKGSTTAGVKVIVVTD